MTAHDRPVALPTLRWGANGRQRALLVHGLSSSAATWWRIADGLAAAGFEVTAPDLRGHGSAPRTVGYRLGGYAADLWELGGGWDLVVGHSLGGTLATLVSADPGYTGRLVLLDPVFMIPEDRFDDVLGEQLAELDDANNPDAIAARHPNWHRQDAELKARAVAATSPYVVERTLQDSRPWWYLDLLGDVRVDTLILGADAEHGAMFDPMIGVEIARRNMRITVSVVPGAGHSVHRDAPDLVLAALVNVDESYRHWEADA